MATVARVAVPGTANTSFTLAADRDRRGLAIYNDTAGDLFVKLGPAASPTSFTVKLVAGAFFELPEAYWENSIVTGACSVTTGGVCVTEF